MAPIASTLTAEQRRSEKHPRTKNFRIESFLGKLGRRTFSLGRREILVEVNQIAVQELPTAFLATALRLEHRASLRGYHVGSLDRNFAGKLSEAFRRLSSPSFLRNKARHKAFSCSRWIRAEKYVSKKHLLIAREFLSQTPAFTLSSFEQIRYRGCLVGDLIYDDFLARNGVATIPLESPELRRHLIECIAVCVFLFEYFEKHRVVAVVGNHVYRQGLVPRIANFLDIPSYEVSLNRVALVSKTLVPHSESAKIREMFAQLSAQEQEDGLNWASKELQGDRLSKDITTYHLKSPSGRKYDDPEQFFDGRFSVLIALHCMTDSPHVRGIGLFPDYLAWLRFTLEACKDFDFLPLIKPHPACPEISNLSTHLGEVFQFGVLPPDIALSQLAESGLGCAITYSGNIGFEAALLGLPVVCAHPHNRYGTHSFVRSPKTLEEYRMAIETTVSAQNPYDIRELQEYLFMSRKYFPDNLFFGDLSSVLRDANNAPNPAEHLAHLFRNEKDSDDFLQIIRILRRFIVSGDQRLTRAHFLESKTHLSESPRL